MRELPPLARGRGKVGQKVVGFLGITPARAGKSAGISPRPNFLRNYPRSRGEELSGRGFYLGGEELPPLARGRVLLEGE